jgi:hypothetical protein
MPAAGVSNHPSNGAPDGLGVRGCDEDKNGKGES